MQLQESDVASIVYQILCGLDHLHQNNTIHRNLKPENIMIEKEEEDAIVCKLMDFGFSSIMDPKGKITISMGNPLYNAPEVLQKKSVDKKADIWSVGVIAYFLLTGELLFDGETRQDIFNAVTAKKEVDFSEKLAKFSDGGKQVEDLLKKCLAK